MIPSVVLGGFRSRGAVEKKSRERLTRWTGLAIGIFCQLMTLAKLRPRGYSKANEAASTAGLWQGHLALHWLCVALVQVRGVKSVLSVQY